MAEDTKANLINEVFAGLENFVRSDTIVGDPIKVDDVTIIPLIEVSCGMAVGNFKKESGNDSGAGGMGAKMTPCALLIVQNGSTRLMTLKNQDAVTKAMDMIPDVFNRVAGKYKVSPKAVAEAEKVAERYK